MSKVLLYGIAAFMETSIGIWLFGQVFPKRERMEKRHVFGEWALFAVITACAYSFPNTFYGIENKPYYIRLLLSLHILILLIYLLINKVVSKEKSTCISVKVQQMLFIGMIICMTAQLWGSFESYPMALLGNIFPVFYLWSFYKCSLRQAYLWQFMYATNLGLLKNVYITYVGVFEQNSFEEFLNWPRSHTYSEAVFLIIISLFLLFVNKYVPLKNIMIHIFRQKQKYLFIFTFMEWLLCSTIIEYGMGRIKEKNLTGSLLIALIIIVCLIILYVRSIINTSSAEKNFYDKKSKIIERQYHELHTAYERYRCVVHDEKHLLLYLQECLLQDDTEEALRFLKSYQGELNRHGKCIWSGIANLDFLLNLKKQQMDEASISFHLDCQIDSIKVEDADFVVLLGNLLDNAIEASIKCEQDKREIYLSLKNVNNMFIIKLKNTYAVQPLHKNFKFLTSKKNADDHGWGLESVKYIVKKYHGEISFHYDKDFFEVSILI